MCRCQCYQRLASEPRVPDVVQTLLGSLQEIGRYRIELGQAQLQFSRILPQCHRFQLKPREEFLRQVEPPAWQVEREILPEIEKLQSCAESVRGAEGFRSTAPMEPKECFPNGICRVMAVPEELCPGGKRAKGSIVPESDQKAAEKCRRQARCLESISKGKEDWVARGGLSVEDLLERVFQLLQQCKLLLGRCLGVIGNIVGKAREGIEVSNMWARPPRQQERGNGEVFRMATCPAAAKARRLCSAPNTEAATIGLAEAGELLPVETQRHSAEGPGVLPPHEVDFVNEDSLPIPEQCQHDRQPDCCFSSSHCHDEKDQQLPFDVAYVS